MLSVGSLFAGIGGLELGLERAGMRVVWQVEKDEYASRVLAKHWPDVTRFEDVRDVGSHNLESVDLICGGFPCQDVSVAGRRAGISGARSGLWSEYARIIGELRPRYVVVENVTGLLSDGLGDVLGALAALGYDAEWRVLSAREFGAPHLRERVFIVAYPERAGRQGLVSDDGILGTAVPAHAIALHGTAAPWLDVEDDSARIRSRDGLSVALERRRLHQLGNAVVPQVAEYIGHCIAMHATQQAAA